MSNQHQSRYQKISYQLYPYNIAYGCIKQELVHLDTLKLVLAGVIVFSASLFLFIALMVSYFTSNVVLYIKDSYLSIVTPQERKARYSIWLDGDTPNKE